MSGQHPQYLKQWVLLPPAETVEIRLPRLDKEEPAVGKGFEVELGNFWLKEETNKWVRLPRTLLSSLFPKPCSIYYPWSTATHSLPSITR